MARARLEAVPCGTKGEVRAAQVSWPMRRVARPRRNRKPMISVKVVRNFQCCLDIPDPWSMYSGVVAQEGADIGLI